MSKLSKRRIRRILERHCVLARAEHFRPYTDEFGDVSGMNRCGEYDVYLSQLLHRYNPYVDLRISDETVVNRRHTPMAILPYDAEPDIKQFDIVRIDGHDYTVSFAENMKGYYYLLSLVAAE